MNYEKLGFVSGQTLKAEHLNYIEDAIEALSESSCSSDNKVILLETVGSYDLTKNFVYNGEVPDVNFLFDCLMSGYQVIVKDNGNNRYLSMINWTVSKNYQTGVTSLKITTGNDNSYNPTYPITLT